MSSPARTNPRQFKRLAGFDRGAIEADSVASQNESAGSSAAHLQCTTAYLASVRIMTPRSPITGHHNPDCCAARLRRRPVFACNPNGSILTGCRRLFPRLNPLFARTRAYLCAPSPYQPSAPVNREHRRLQLLRVACPIARACNKLAPDKGEVATDKREN